MLANKGQSLIEILVALAIFILVISTVFSIVASSFLSIRQAQERLQAVFLAQEGLEAVRSIRDNDWASLTNGSHGLTITDNHWVLNGTEENLGSQLNQGKRQIAITDYDIDQKLINAKVSWELTPARINEVMLFTVLGNLQRASAQPGTCQGTATRCRDISEQVLCQNQDGCLWEPGYCDGQCRSCNSLSMNECLLQQGCYLEQVGPSLKCRGNCLKCDNFSEQNPCLNQLGCNWQPGDCLGTVLSCDNYINQIECEAQNGCSWIPN